MTARMLYLYGNRKTIFICHFLFPFAAGLNSDFQETSIINYVPVFSIPLDTFIIKRV